MLVSREKSLVLASAVAVLATFTASPKPAQAAVIYSETADQGVYHSAASSTTLLAAVTNNYEDIGINGGLERTLVLPFKLPERPAGMHVSTANLAVSVKSITAGSPIDLYGLDTRSTPTVAKGDFYAGPGDASATLIQQTFISSSTPTNDARTGTSSAADVVLADFLNAQYDNGATAGDYVFFRLNRQDTSIGPFSLTSIYAADQAPFIANALANNVDPSMHDYYYNYYIANYTPKWSPELDLTFAAVTVPEPASLALLGLGAAALFTRRRKR